MKKLYLSTLLIVCMSQITGQIQTYSTNDTIQLNIPDGVSESAYIDINQDGVNDLGLTKAPTGTSHFCQIYGINDSTDVLHQYFEDLTPPGSISGWATYGVKDSTISGSSEWMALQFLNPTASIGGGMIHHTNPNYPNDLVNSSFYLGFRFYIEGSDFISRFHYGCLDATLTQNALLIIHGWSYETQPNTPITCTDSLLNDFTSISEERNVFPIIYPNPSNTGLIQLNTSIVNSDINVYSIEGKQINFTQSNNVIDISDNEKGIYLISIDGIVTRYVYQE